MTEKIIKGNSTVKRGIDVTSPEGSVVSRQVLSAHEKAEKILKDAEHEAARIVQEASSMKAGIEAIREQARREGLAEGKSEGLAQVTEMIVRLESLKEQFYVQAEPEVIRLVTDIAEKIIGDLAEKYPDVIRHVVHQALERCIGDRITVRLNSADYAVISSDENAFRHVIDRTRRLMFKEDDAILRGGCVVETEVGVIDAQLETQLAAIKKALAVSS